MVALPALLLSTSAHMAASCAAQETQSAASKAKGTGCPQVRSSCESTAREKPNTGLYGKQNCRERGEHRAIACKRGKEEENKNKNKETN